MSVEKVKARVYHSDRYTLPLPEWHRFPMRKYALLRQQVERAAWSDRVRLLEPPAASDADLERVHDPGYVRRVATGGLRPEEEREIGLPWSEGLVERSRRSTGGTIAAARAALEDFASVNLAGGTHHAHVHKGAGYGVFNDAAVAARALLAEGRVERVVILDCDVHHGDGTAAIFADDPRVFTYSIHSAKNYPMRKPPSDLDVPLPDGIGDTDYLARLEETVPQALDRAGANLAIYLAGADPYEGDRLGRLKLTKEGLRRRDAFIFAECRRRMLPVAVTMAGGYAEPIEDTVEIQLATVRAAVALAVGRD